MWLLLLLLSGCFAGLVAAVCTTIFELHFWRIWGNGWSGGMAGERFHSLPGVSRVYSERGERFNSSCNALVSWRRSRSRFSSSSTGLVRKNDLVVPSPELCNCVSILLRIIFPFLTGSSLSVQEDFG
jgi:hypothetical protein